MLTANALLDKSVALLLMRMLQFATIAVVFIPLERLIPFHRGQRLFRERFVLDLCHYFAGGFITYFLVRLTYVGMPLLTSRLGYEPPTHAFARLPWLAQFAIWEFGWTFLGYWLHRLAHVWRPLWRLHVIHESSREIDWLAAFRLHPLEPALFQLLTIVPLWLLGVKLQAAIGYTIYTYVFTHIQHANVTFVPLGPLKYILPTPEFHRWHHARVVDSVGGEQVNLCNFGQYPIFDVLFGTFYLPDERPVAYGSAWGDSLPCSYLAQLAYPFGLHDRVLAWRAAAARPFRRLGARVDAAQQAIAPLHSNWENQLARLCLLPAARAEVGAAPLTLTPSLEGEKS